jgi:hypothetical protein
MNIQDHSDILVGVTFTLQRKAFRLPWFQPSKSIAKLAIPFVSQ